jgi:transcription elongation factor GreA
MQKIPMTVSGEQLLRDRLKHLKTVERPKNINDIEVARAHGDLSENAEYHSAKEKQSMLDAQMREITDKLSRAEVIDPQKLSGSRVVFGATVLLEDLDSEEQVTYQIVGSEEADPKAGRISYTSPLARAIIGKMEGDFVDFEAPGGIREYDIIKVEFK